MGREIRRVPPNWEHPKRENYGREDEYQPMYDKSFEHAKAEWIHGFNKWYGGEPESEEDEYWEYYGDPPKPEYYRPNWTASEMTWFQVYETVSEGTPVSPPFETPEELARYLADNGDFWCQRRRKDFLEGRNHFLPLEQPPTYEQALAFVTMGWAPSGAMVQKDGESKMLNSYEASEEQQKNAN